MTESVRARFASIRAACEHLDQDCFEPALEAISGSDPGFVVIECIGLTARGLLLERAGEAEAAADQLERAYGLGVPQPALLRQWGRYFKRVERYDRAYECYSLLAQLRPRVVAEFVDGLPPRELVRYAPWTIRQLLARDPPGLYALQPTKAALARELGPDGAVRTFAQLAGLGSGWSARRLPIRSLHGAARCGNTHFEVLQPSRDVFLASPPLFGATPCGGVQTSTRTVFRSELDDVVVSGRSSFLVTADEALFDVQDDELDRFELDLDLDPVVFAPRDGAATFLVGRGAATEPALERGFPLTGVTSVNFGHWVLEYLPKVLACLGSPGFDTVPILVDRHMPPQHHEALELVVGADHPVVALDPGAAVKVRRLSLCSAFMYLPLGPKPGQDPADGVVTRSDALTVDPDAFAALFTKVEAQLRALEQPDGPRRIYLARKDSQHRRVVNRPEVEEWFASNGFAVLDLGALPFREQVALVRGADIVVGPDGSANLISLFGRPGTRIGVLTNSYAEENEWYALVCRALGQPLSILTGEVVNRNTGYRTFSDYRIDVGMLPAYVDHLVRLP